MAVDPVCKMNVDESTALRVEQDEQTIYFCSKHCLKKFLGEATSVPITDLSAVALPAQIGVEGAKAEHRAPTFAKASVGEPSTEHLTRFCVS